MYSMEWRKRSNWVLARAQAASAVRHVWFIGVAAVLAACGGGGGGNAPQPPPPPPSSMLSIADAVTDEGDSGNVDLTFTVSLSAATITTVTVNIASEDDSATAGEDYTAVSETVDIPPGDTSASVTVSVTGDNAYEPDESFTLRLSNPVGATLGTAEAIGTISNDDAPDAPQVTLEFGIKQLQFAWDAVDGANFYRVLENPNGGPGFTTVADQLQSTAYDHDIAIHLGDWEQAQYLVEACNAFGCTGTDQISAMNSIVQAIGYFKSSNTFSEDRFGNAVALSSDGGTLAVAAPKEFEKTGGVYVFRFDGAHWTQQAHIKASNAGMNDEFGSSVALSEAGNTLAVGAIGEDSEATGINGNEGDNNALVAGAVYLFRYNGRQWTQQAYVKASNTGVADFFGNSVTLSADGNTLAVGATGEDSNATGTNGDKVAQSNDTAASAGAAYVFRYDGAQWGQQSYIKASNTDPADLFGHSVVLSADGFTLAVGAISEDSKATGINHVDEDDNTSEYAGVVYLFRSDGAQWTQQAYVKASNTDPEDFFGDSVALSADGNTLVVGASGEYSNATGTDGGTSAQQNNDAEDAGAVYVFRFDGAQWAQQAYIKASNTGAFHTFGVSVAVAGNGNMLAVGAYGEDSIATGVGGDQTGTMDEYAGAVYVYRFDGSLWSQQSYVKASNTDRDDEFGSSVALSDDGNTLAVGAWLEDSKAIGIGGDKAAQQNDDATDAGAVYVY